MPQLILASRSPRRVELLKLITDDFKVIPSDFDESAISISQPISLVKELSFQKAKTIFEKNQSAIVIGCDTVVSLNNEIFGIPNDKAHARTILQALSSNTHQVTTGVCVMTKDEVYQFEVQTDVTFYQLSEIEIEEYLCFDEAFDKAGAYGIQGKGSLFVSSILGDYFAVVGLPIASLKRVLSRILV